MLVGLFILSGECNCFIFLHFPISHWSLLFSFFPLQWLCPLTVEATR